MTVLDEVYFLGLLLDWITKWISLSPEFLSQRDLPLTRLRAFIYHREAHRTAARPQRLFLRKGIRIVYQTSAVWPSGSERRFYDGHDRKIDGSTPT